MRRLLLSILAIVMGGMMLHAPAMAAEEEGECGEGCVKTSILGENGCSCDDQEGGEIKRLLWVVVDMMSIGVGILGVLGITIVGIQYLTAGGNEEKTRKAKMRMFEIVIGIALYVVVYALLRWLIPEFDDSL